MARSDRYYELFQTSAGWCGVAWSDAAIVRFQLPVTSEAGAQRLMLRRMPDAIKATPSGEVQAMIVAVRSYFAGERVDFSTVRVDLGTQDAFFARVYEAVRRLNWGETTTYGGLARELGAGPQAARDVGQAMASNPIPLIIPCHRVLAAGNKIGGFSAPGGSETKRRMLEMEGVGLAPPRPVQQSLGF